MTIRYDVVKLKSVIDDYAAVAGISISVLDTEFRTLVSSSAPVPAFCLEIQRHKEGRRLCVASDLALLCRCRDSKRFEVHTCHAGIADAVYPILKNGAILGYIMLGRMRNSEDFEQVAPCLAWMPDAASMEEKYRQLEYFEKSRVQSIANVAAIVAAYILTDNIIDPEYDEKIKSALEYIEEHIDEPLSADTLCRQIHLSKSSLYTCFRMVLNCTVNEYVTMKRVEKAKKLLVDTTLSAGAIAEAVGIRDVTYFCKLFKKETSFSPLQYRKQMRKI